MAHPAPASERGATALEFAMIAPVLLLLLFGGIEAGRFLFLASTLRHATAGAARCVAIDPAGCGTANAISRQIEGSMRRLAGAISVPPSALTLGQQPCGLHIGADIAYPALLLPPAEGLRLRAEACARTP